MSGEGYTYVSLSVIETITITGDSPLRMVLVGLRQGHKKSEDEGERLDIHAREHERS
jgi:hypothetical protein